MTKLEKVLSKQKVVQALNDTSCFFTYYPTPMYSGSYGTVDEVIRRILSEEVPKMIQEAISQYTLELSSRLDQCEPDQYPCALCYDSEGKENI